MILYLNEHNTDISSNKKNQNKLKSLEKRRFTSDIPLNEPVVGETLRRVELAIEELSRLLQEEVREAEAVILPRVITSLEMIVAMMMVMVAGVEDEKF